MKFSLFKAFVFMGSVSIGYAQNDSKNQTTDAVMIIGKPSAGEIVLRWAPLTYDTWHEGLTYGYTIERYTLVRDKKALATPEHKVLTNATIKPLPEMEWEPLVKREKYAAIAAQAMFGSDFTLALNSNNVFQIVNKAQENEQRFHFALFCADMSVTVARASGLIFIDTTVSVNEKYLYKIKINSQKSLEGSLFIGPADVYSPPSIKDVHAEEKDNTVMVQWSQDRMRFYTAYEVERSVDGKNFTVMGNDVVTNLSPEQRESKTLFIVDTIRHNNSSVYYRVHGITPFGERGQSSDIAKAVLRQVVLSPPHITASSSLDNKNVTLQWTVSQNAVGKIKGFHIDRSSTPKGDFKRLTTTPLSELSRSFMDTNPEQINYYRVAMVSSQTAQEFYSPIHLIQLVDSIPPTMPVDVTAVITEQGVVTLSWKANSETDIYGYRIYRGNIKSEEFSQRTSEPMQTTTFTDSVNLQTLNKEIHYQVMAIDRNQNHSELSRVLSVRLPDKVKPVPPVFLPVRSSEEGVMLKWERSSSDDVARYEIFRKQPSEKLWTKIDSKQATRIDTFYHYLDTRFDEKDGLFYYTITAVDSSGQSSEPTQAVSGSKIKKQVLVAVVFEKPVIDRELKQIVLRWNYTVQGVQKYQIYRSVGNEPPTLYKSIAASSQLFKDASLTPTTKYTYHIIAVFDDQRKSALSSELVVAF